MKSGSSFTWKFGQVMDVYVSRRRDLAAARRFFEVALRDHGRPAEVVTDKEPSLIGAVDELLPDAYHDTERCANDRARAITPGSSPGCGPCGACNVTGPRRS
jgi:transposase-like protein